MHIIEKRMRRYITIIIITIIMKVLIRKMWKLELKLKEMGGQRDLENRHKQRSIHCLAAHCWIERRNSHLMVNTDYVTPGCSLLIPTEYRLKHQSQTIFIWKCAKKKKYSEKGNTQSTKQRVLRYTRTEQYRKYT